MFEILHTSYNSCQWSNPQMSSGNDVTDNKTNNLTPLFDLKTHIYTMNDIFHREDQRLKTFDHWPLEWMDKYQLAQTGMFYTGEEDKVKCYFCEVEIGRWERTDQPLAEHLRWSQNCPLLRRRTTNNVPISAEALEAVLPPISYDICGANDTIAEDRPYTMSSPGHMMMVNGSGSLPASTAAATAENTPTYFPEYPEYAIEAARLRSFAEWPMNMKQKPQQLAEAGFFYTGVGDRVKCFSCGGGLKDWDDNDEPWEQHAIWLSKCRFLKLIKGTTYIDAVVSKHKAKETVELNEGEQQQQLCTTEALQASNDMTTAPAVAAMATTPADSFRDALNVPSTMVSAETSNSCDVAPQRSSVRCMRDRRCISEGNANMSTATITNSHSNYNSNSSSSSNSTDEKLCKICYAADYNTAFLPCGHVVACAKCASSVTKCPLCRKPFTDVMRVYFS